MSRVIKFFIVSAIPLVLLITLFLFWTDRPIPDMSATVVDTVALATNTVLETSVTTQPSTTTEIIPPSEIRLATPADLPTIPALSTEKTTEILPETATPTSPQPVKLTSLIHSLTNVTRTKHNRADIVFDEKLSVLAKARSEEMIRLEYFSHTSPSGCDVQCRFTNSDYMTQSWGENLAEANGYQHSSNQELAAMFMQWWLQSDEHRDNLLSPTFTHEGIGVAVKGDRTVVTVIFAVP